jgi:isoquinoline 1-oxidoreductase beta subunit
VRVQLTGSAISAITGTPASSSPTRGCITRQHDHLHARSRRDGAGHDDVARGAGRRRARGRSARAEDREYAEASRAYDNPDKQINIQITGGSTARKRRGAARSRRGRARDAARGAGARWGVPIETRGASTIVGACRIPTLNKGTVPRSPDAPYVELVDCVEQDVPHVHLKIEDWKVIGKSIDRLDAVAKLDSSGVRGIDVKLPGMVTAVLLRARRGSRSCARSTHARRSPSAVSSTSCRSATRSRSSRPGTGKRAAADVVAVEWDEGHRARSTATRCRVVS